MKKNKGITLVALVVTIVVLLILAGVSINLVLGNNGIIAKAKDAETKSAEASQNDLIGMNELAQQLEEQINGSTGSGSGNGGAGGSGTDTKVPEVGTSETAPYFPDNTFTKKEGTIDTGLVIKDASGNEYVWVVVPRTTAVYKTTWLGKTTFTDADYTSIENDLKEYTKTYRGSTSFITDTWYADEKNEGWLSETEYKTLKNSMLKSVYENGGFYVGRYEAGIAENRTGNTDKNSDGKYTIEGMPTPVTKADAYPYTYVTRTQAQNLASKVNAGTKTSSLMFGVQWDLVLAFMHNKGNIEDSTLTSNSTTIGNYYNSTFDLNRGKYAQCGQLGNTWKNFDSALDSIVVSNETTGKMKKTEQNSYKNGILLTTGGTEQSKVMNIYDIAGNVYEWTLEKTPNTYEPCVTRGGLFNDTGSYRPAAEHGGSSSGHSFYSIGFRVSIF